MPPEFSLPSLAHIFGNRTGTPATATPQHAAAPANPAATADAASGMQQTNPAADPANQNLDAANLGADGKPKKQSSELDAFTDIFTIDPKKPVSKDPMKEPLLNLDPKTLAAAVSKMDFAKGISPDLLAKAFPGGDSVAIQSLLNGVSRSVYMMAFQGFTKLTESAIGTNNARFETVLGGRFRDFQVSASQSTNKALQHPAAKPVVSALKTMIAAQKPDLSAEEVTQQAENYFLAMGKSLNSIDAENERENRNKDGGNDGPADWSGYLETGNIRN